MKRLPLLMLLSAFSVAAGLKPTAAEIITLPQDFSAVRAFPNPWRADRPTAAITFDQLPQASVSSLRIFTISGELVRSLTGSGSIPWDLTNNHGQRVASGIYIYLLTGGGQKKIGKICVIR